tara:strand:- start:2068 stop:2367 length:300 start_codon:yes stop_codon:yes gene_type:complete
MKEGSKSNASQRHGDDDGDHSAAGGEHSRRHDPPRTSTQKINLEELVLRAAPRPFTRINHRVLIWLSGTGLLLILGATIFVMVPPVWPRDRRPGYSSVS